MLQRETDDWDFSATVKCSLEVSVAGPAEMDCLGQVLDSVLLQFLCHINNSDMRKPFLRNPLVSKLSQLWQDHCTKFLEVIQRNNRNLLDVEYMWGLEQKWNALCPFYIYCDYFQIITSGKLSWINFWYKALILNSFPNDLLQATTITTKKAASQKLLGQKSRYLKNEFWITV